MVLRGVDAAANYEQRLTKYLHFKYDDRADLRNALWVIRLD